MFTTIITDCKGENEAGRQITRYSALGLGPASLIGIDSSLTDLASLESGCNLVDVLDASEGKRGVVVVNVAPRGHIKVDGTNGSSFSYFHHKETLVISTVGHHCLSFVKKLKLASHLNLLETSKVLSYAHQEKLIGSYLVKHIEKTQFRSFEFVPRVAKWLTDGFKLPTSRYSLENIPDVPHCVWCIDAFGNAKTTILSKEIKIIPGNKLKTSLGEFTFYERLKNIPYGKTGIYVGSSGIGNNRFLEIATQGKSGSVKKTLNLKLGDKITI